MKNEQSLEYPRKLLRRFFSRDARRTDSISISLGCVRLTSSFLPRETTWNKQRRTQVEARRISVVSLTVRTHLRFQADSSHESLVWFLSRGRKSGKSAEKKARNIFQDSRNTLTIFSNYRAIFYSDLSKHHHHALRSLVQYIQGRIREKKRWRTTVPFVLVKSSVKTKLARMNPHEEYSLSSQKLHAQKTLSSSGGELLPFYREFFHPRFIRPRLSLSLFRDFRCHFLAVGRTITRKYFEYSLECSNRLSGIL